MQNEQDVGPLHERLTSALGSLQPLYQRKRVYGSVDVKGQGAGLLRAAVQACDSCQDAISGAGAQHRHLLPLLLHLRGLAGYLQHGSTAAVRTQLEGAVKLAPASVDAWNCLAHCHWEEEELLLARCCLLSSLKACSNKEAMQMMSMLIRQQVAGSSGPERSEALALSLQSAKAAIEIDVHDGFSWYVLALAQLSQYLGGTETFVPRSNAERPRQLQRCLASFSQAERCGITALADLHYNRAALHTYCQSFGEALRDYAAAAMLDPGLPCQAQTESLLMLVGQLSWLVSSRGGVNGKLWTRLTGLLARDAMKGAELLPHMYYEPLTLSSLLALQPGVNKGKALLCRPLVFLAPPLNASATLYLVCADTSGSCFALALVRVAHDAFNLSQLLTVVNPELHEVEVNYKEQNYKFPMLKVDSLNTVLVEGIPIQQDTSAQLLHTCITAG
ncbi:MAG: hypothetical protein WDW36_000721 [Sanguina aurantia]